MGKDEKTITQPGPLDTINNLTAAINRGDLAAMLSFFERDAVLVVQWVYPGGGYESIMTRV